MNGYTGCLYRLEGDTFIILQVLAGQRKNANGRKLEVLFVKRG